MPIAYEHEYYRDTKDGNRQRCGGSGWVDAERGASTAATPCRCNPRGETACSRD